jgi:sugar/nucleoside kinase (ribokinase family)
MAARHRARVICVGTAVVDTIFAVDRLPLAPGKNFASSVMQVGGGVAANAAVTVAALGGEGVLWSRVGDDASGMQIVRELADWRVEVGAVQRVSGVSSSISTVLVDASGDRQIVNYLDPRLLQDAEGLPFEDIAGADALMCDVRWLPAVTVALAEARAHGRPGIVDFEVVPEAGTEALLGMASHVAFAREALAEMAATDDVDEGLRRASGRTGAWLAVTCGEQGVYWLQDGVIRHQPAYRVEVVDTLAAGDVFHGALALALAERQPIEPAVRFASAAAALKCTRFGGREGIPDRAAVERFVRENG